jgi:hypothetical protein
MQFHVKALSVLALVVAVPTAAQADVITDWNQTAIRTLLQAKLPSGAPTRALAMMHAAMFEAVNSIEPRYAPYNSAQTVSPGASAEAAASAAAYRVLAAVLPAQESNLESRHQFLTSNIRDASAKAAGVAVGEKAAAAILALRANDGSDFSLEYQARSGSGMYVATSNAAMASPSLSKMKPFVMATSDHFRPPPPPAADSAQAIRDLEEVKVLGQKASAARTRAQTDIAIFHVPPGFLVWNSIARSVVEAKALDLADSARTMALMNFVFIDAQLAIWDAKYAYNLWRPRTAINAGVQQVATAGAPVLWEPLLNEPMHPEYPCAHCGVGAAAATALEGLFGSGPFHFAARTGQLGGAVRAYTSFRQFEEEEAVSRIYGGVHVRWSNVVGEAVGKQVAKKVLDILPAK